MSTEEFTRETDRINPQPSEDDWGSFNPPPMVKSIYKCTACAGMVTGIILAFPFMAGSSARAWFTQSKKDNTNE